MYRFFSRKIFLIAVVLFVGIQGFGQATQSQKPNIIFILTDDLGYGDLGVFYQNQRQLTNDRSKPVEFTPQLDKMASQGAIFSNQYANAPVCAPSRASFLTGTNQGNAHVRNNQFDKALEDNYTVANVLKAAGYATVAIGKWGLQGEKEEAPNWPAHPLKRGFDYFFGYMRHVDGHEHYPVEGIYRGSKEVWENYKNVANDLAKCYTTDLWTAKAKQWIIDHQKQQAATPFFMFLAYDAPHAVLELATQSYPQGGGLQGGLQWLNTPGKMINTASGVVDSYVNPEYANATYDNDKNPATPEVPWPNTYKRYASSVKRIDDGVGDILTLLKDLKLDNNTLVVFTSDNGASIESYLPSPNVPNHPDFFGSNGPFDGIKRDVWEGGLRVPTIAYWPGVVKPRTQIDKPSMLSDWMPTFADMAKIDVPARADGATLMPSLKQKGNQVQSPVYVEYFESGKTPNFDIFEASRRNRKRGEMQMLRIGDYVGVRYNIQSAADNFEIYNVAVDPKQTQNLASRNEFSAMENQFKALALQSRRADDKAKRPYDDALIPSVENKNAKQRGFAVSYYPSDADYVIKPDALGSKPIDKPIKKGKSAPADGTKILTTYWPVPTDGAYQIRFQSQQASFVRLHNATLFDADYGYTNGNALNETRWLKAGLHPLSIAVKLKKGQSEKFDLSWRKLGDQQWQSISDTAVIMVDADAKR
jgi:arylsulfatase A-like enzyme